MKYYCIEILINNEEMVEVESFQCIESYIKKDECADAVSSPESLNKLMKQWTLLIKGKKIYVVKSFYFVRFLEHSGTF